MKEGLEKNILPYFNLLEKKIKIKNLNIPDLFDILIQSNINKTDEINYLFKLIAQSDIQTNILYGIKKGSLNEVTLDIFFQFNIDYLIK